MDASDFILAFRCNPIEILEGLLPGNVTLVNTSVLILFCGTLTLAGVLAYYFSKKVEKKEKILSGVLLAFMVLSAIFVPLENIWNGFRNVASYYCRFSFVSCFFMGYLAADFFRRWELSKHYKQVAAFCSVAVAAELLYNDFTVIKSINLESAEAYLTYAEEARQSAASLKALDPSVFYRTEQTSSYGLKEGNYFGTYNEGMAYGYMPFASYPSTYDSAIAHY